MALSNIFREPHREITETVAGLLWVGGAITLGYHIPLWLGATRPEDKILGFVLASIFIGISPFALILCAVAIHGLGEVACDMMAAMGLDPRPARRR